MLRVIFALVASTRDKVTRCRHLPYSLRGRRGTAFAVDVVALGKANEEYRAAADRTDASARDLYGTATELRRLVIVGYATGASLLLAGAACVWFSLRAPGVVAVPTYGGVSAGWTGDGRARVLNV